MVHQTYGEIPVKLVFLHAGNCNHEWVTLLTTDLSLSDEEIVRIYGKRWNIRSILQNEQIIFKFSQMSFNVKITIQW